MSPETVREVIRRYFTAIRAMDVEAWVGTFACDAVSHDPVGAPAIEGHSGLRQFFLGVAGAFREVSLREEHVFINGDQAAVKWSGEGVGRNGRRVTFDGIDVFRFNPDGRIQQLWGYWNPTAMMAELGDLGEERKAA